MSYFLFCEWGKNVHDPFMDDYIEPRHAGELYEMNIEFLVCAESMESATKMFIDTLVSYGFTFDINHINCKELPNDKSGNIVIGPYLMNQTMYVHAIIEDRTFTLVKNASGAFDFVDKLTQEDLKLKPKTL